MVDLPVCNVTSVPSQLRVSRNGCCRVIERYRGILEAMMLNLFVILCCLVVRSRCDDVLVFTDEDFDRGINEHNIVLVKFFSPG